MSEKQFTIKKECSISGVGLHTGEKATVVLKPAKVDEGVRFVRVDLPDNPVIKADLSSVSKEQGIPRCTSIGEGDATIHTVEHLMSVLIGLGIDNLTVEIDAKELPGLDGSGIEFLKTLRNAGIDEQDADKKYFEIYEPIGVEANGASIFVTPAPEFKISYTLNYDHPFLKSQFYSVQINRDSYEKEIAPSRTFCLESEAKELQNKGLGKGANYDNTLVVGDRGVVKNKVRFEDEFARHKILDFIGDISLLGMPIRGHVFAIRSGHYLNLSLLKKIHRQKANFEKMGILLDHDWSGYKEYSISEIMKVIPHRFPFLFVDRVIEIEKGKKAIGIKNVTINDDFFRGHFPTKPVMPGVLMIEAMAQTAGVVVLTSGRHRGKVALFMSIDKVKFRRMVSPGDQLLMEVDVVSDKSKIVKIKTQAKVGKELVAEAELVFSYTDASLLTA